MPPARQARSAANVPETPTPAPRRRTSDEYRSARLQRWTKSHARQPPLPRPSHRKTIQSPKCASFSNIHRTKLKFQSLQVFAEGAAQLAVQQSDFDGRFQKSEFVARIVRNAVINV